MTALNKNTVRIFEEQDDSNAIPIVGQGVVFQGSLIGQTPEGYGRALQSGDTPVGFAKDEVDNSTGEDGDKNIELKAKGKVSIFLTGLTPSDIGKSVFASDDNTFSLSRTDSYVGKVVRFEKADYGIVAFDFLQPLDLVDDEPQTQTQEPNTEG